MINGQPTEGQVVQVKIDGGEWQTATFREGHYVDLYGLPLDASKVSEWKLEARTPARPEVRAQIR
jgi:hypothetical protein